jgi:hypothetical protein
VDEMALKRFFFFFFFRIFSFLLASHHASFAPYSFLTPYDRSNRDMSHPLGVVSDREIGR